jgi:hypothetical protein
MRSSGLDTVARHWQNTGFSLAEALIRWALFRFIPEVY